MHNNYQQKPSHSWTVGMNTGTICLPVSTRAVLFGEQRATYTGLSQWRGVAPKPEPYLGKAVVMSIDDNGSCLLLMSTDDSTMVWAQRDLKAIDEAAAEEFKKSPFAHWDFGGGEAIKNSTKISSMDCMIVRSCQPGTRGGWFSLETLRTQLALYHGGEGANQSFEDIDILVQQIEKYVPSTESPSARALESALQEFEGVRIPQSSASVEKARELMYSADPKLGTEEHRKMSLKDLREVVPLIPADCFFGKGLLPDLQPDIDVDRVVGNLVKNKVIYSSSGGRWANFNSSRQILEHEDEVFAAWPRIIDEIIAASGVDR
ncbi:hypothetical protein PHLGIDRAFT_118971, partial [Phlebiopsis gigantea 11061_1 CR5-6]